METTIKQKEYIKKYKKEHKEEQKEYMKNYYKNNKSYYKTYFQIYYLEHKEHMLETARKWREENAKIDTIYMFIDNNENTIYCGSSSRFRERISSHCTSNSNLNMSAEEMVDKYNLEKIIYKDFTQYELSRDDLFFLEFHQKENTKEILKTKKVHVNEENLTRSKENLIDILNQVKWQTFNKLDKYLN